MPGPMTPHVARTFLLCTLVVAGLQAQCQNVWSDGYGCPGTLGYVNAMTRWDPDGSGPLPEHVVVGGESLRVVGDATCDNLAMWNEATGAWVGLPAAPLPVVGALAVTANGELLVACSTYVYQPPVVGRVAVWNGTAWTTLGGDFDSEITDLLVHSNGDVFAVGSFATNGATALPSAARWNGLGWQPLVGLTATRSGGLLEMPNSDVWFGGQSDVWRWNGTLASNLASVAVGNVATLALTQASDVLVGGDAGLARYDGVNWTPVAGLDGSPYPAPSVTALLPLPNGEVIVSGEFSRAGGVVSRGIASLDPQALTWSVFGSGMSQSIGRGHALATRTGGGFVVGGNFTSVDALQVRSLAAHDGVAWQAVWDAPFAVSCGLPVSDTEFYVGGRFTNAGNVNASLVALWDGSAWSAVGGGLSSSQANAEVRDLVLLPNGDVLATGSFETAGSVPAAGLAVWNGTSWSEFAGGLQSVNGAGSGFGILPQSDGSLVVSGWFVSAGGVAANNIARWQAGVGWSALGAGLPAYPGEVVNMPGGGLLAVASNDIWQWDGSTWTMLASYPSSTGVQAIAVLPDGNIVVAGSETQFFGQFSQAFVELWPSPIRYYANPQFSWISGMTVLPDASVLVAGQIGAFDGQPANGFVRIYPSTMGAVPTFDTSTPGGPVEDFEQFPNGDLLLVGGLFGVAGTPSYAVARLSRTCPALALASGMGCAGAGGVNVLTATSLPWIGSTFASEATGMPATGLALGVRGLTTVTLPLAGILSQGQPGCDLLVSPDLLDLYVLGGGPLMTSFSIPNAVALVGQVLHQQVVPIELHAQGNIMALTSTNRLSLTIGVF